MAAAERGDHGGRARARVEFAAGGRVRVETGVGVLDHLLGLAAEYGAFDLVLEVAPGGALQEVADAGRALGEALRGPLTAPGVRGHGSAAVPVAEALAHVALDASGRAHVATNVDLAEARLGGLEIDAVARFLRELAAGADLTLHVRLIEGRETQHVLEAIFKSLGVALAQATRPRTRKEHSG